MTPSLFHGRAGTRCRRALLTTLVALACWPALACGPGAFPQDFASAVATVEGALPPVPEVVASPDGKAVLASLGPRPGATPEPIAAAGRVYDEPLAASMYGAALDAWAERAARHVRAYGVFVRDGSSGRIVAAGSYWVSPLVDRLQVVRLAAPVTTLEPSAELLRALGSCHVPVREWIVIELDVARDLLTASGDVHAYLVAKGGPGEVPVRRWVEGGDLMEAAAFMHPATEDLASFSAWFVGSGPGPVALARAVPRVRSTLGPKDLWELIRGIR